MSSIFLTGPQALIVSSAFDPESMLGEWAKRGFSPKLWTPKLTGTDTGDGIEILHGMMVARSQGLSVGGWIQCGLDPDDDVKSVQDLGLQLDYLLFACEIEYKGNTEPLNEWRADWLIEEATMAFGTTLPFGVITYGAYDSFMRMQSFAKAGWHVFPEAYGAFTLSQADTYYPMFLGVAIHPLQRKLPPDKYRGNKCGVYRPEGLL